MPEPQGPNRLVRLIVPLIALAIGVIVVLSFATKNEETRDDTTTAQTDGGQTETNPGEDAATAEPPGTPAEKPDTATTQDPPPNGDDPPPAEATASEFKPFQSLVVRPEESAENPPLGSVDRSTDFKMQVEFTQWGAGISELKMAEYKAKVGSDEPLILAEQLIGTTDNAQTGEARVDQRIYPFAARSVTINGKKLQIDWKSITRWKNVSPGVFELTIEDGQGNPVLRITRKYTLGKGTSGFDIHCVHQFENLSDRPIQVTWEQVGTVDLDQDKSGYDRDYRAFVAGYFNLANDPNRARVRTDGTYIERSTLLSGIESGEPGLWPNDDVDVTQAELLWVGNVNRHFTTVVHRWLPESTPLGPNGGVTVPPLDEIISGIQVDWIGDSPTQKNGDTQSFSILRTHTLVIQPSADESFELALYAGPRDSRIFEELPYSWFGFENLIVYSFGCPCTFAWLAQFLIGFLRWIHWVVQDWGVAIIILVLCVRGLLHPITKKGQINMMKMGKAMQALQPEMEKLKKKYENDQPKLQAEMMKLYREKGANPLNMLGCLPMFLQTPIWIALYAMLYFAVELRHEAAFYGVFQKFGDLFGIDWNFLADLSGQDHFVDLTAIGWDFTIPLPFFGDIAITSFNILPILWVFVLMINQKLTTPPPVTEQAAQQQKMMKYMTMLFPIFLYKAPCGLTLYILTSTFAGIIDSTIVRRHIKREEEAGTLLTPKDPDKKGGCVGGKLGERFQKAMEMQQQRMAEVKKEQQKAKGPMDKRKKKKR